jgi:hypothetical protein
MNSSDITNGDGTHHGLDGSPTSSSSEIGMSGAGDGKTAGQPLSDFLLQLEDYIPTVRNVDNMFNLSRHCLACSAISLSCFWTIHAKRCMIYPLI